MYQARHRETTKNKKQKHLTQEDGAPTGVTDPMNSQQAASNQNSEELLDTLKPEVPDEIRDGHSGPSPVHSSANRGVILSTHFNVFLYSTCYWIQNGTLPYLTKKLGADPVTFGYLQTVFAVVQLTGGPVFGRFGDIFGGRAALTLAFGSAAASYALLGVSDSIFVLFMSRLPSVFMHGMQGGQMIVTDVCDKTKRADALGKLGMSYGVGMVIGPFVGGIITKHFGEHFAAFVAAAGSVVSMFLVMRFIPGQTKKTASGFNTQLQGKNVGASSVFNVKKLLALLAAPGALFLLLVRFFAGIPISVFQSMFQVVALETFKLAPDQNGYLMSYIGITTMFVQGIGVGFVTKTFSETITMLASSFILVWSYILLSQVGSVVQLCLVCLPLVVGLTTQNVVITSSLTHTVSPENTGAILGLNMAVNSLVRTFSPTCGGYLLRHYGFPSFGYFGFVVSALLTVVLFVKHRRKTI